MAGRSGKVRLKSRSGLCREGCAARADLRSEMPRPFDRLYTIYSMWPGNRLSWAILRTMGILPIKVGSLVAAMGKAKTEKTSQFEKALLTLRRLVLDGAFEPNSRLPEVAISERLGISRTPLREAMARLVEEGLLERLETGGCRVASFTMADIIDAIEIRGVLEGTAARFAAERGVDSLLADACREVLAGLDKAVFGSDDVDFESYVRLNARFHEILHSLSAKRAAGVRRARLRGA